MKTQLLMMACVLTVATSAPAGRYEQLTARFASGEKMTPVAATFFGGRGAEEFVDAGQLPDGVIVAFGNSSGPDFPATPKPVVLGLGKHRGLKAVPTNGKGEKIFAQENPDLAGMLVFYDDKLSRVLKTVRFDWGVASLSIGTVSEDGKALFVAGRCTEAFRTLARQAKSFKVEPYGAPPAPAEVPGKKPRKQTPPAIGPYTYEGVPVSGDVFVARLSTSGEQIEWVWIFEGLRKPPEQLWSDKNGALYFDVRGLRRISADGQKAEVVNTRLGGGAAGWRGVDPHDGGLFYGGDRNTHTGYQPYRQPFLYKYDQKNQKLWTLWEPNPKECACGGSGNGLCSDSSARGVVVQPNGDLVVLGWSDGGNSVFTRQPTDWRKGLTSRSALGMEAWGMKGANSLAYLMVIDGKNLRAESLDLVARPDNFENAKNRGAPNFASITALRSLADGSIGFHGATATGLIQTPNALYKPPTDGRRFGGNFVAVMTPEMNDLLFSTHLPGCENISLGSTKRGMLVVSRSAGKDHAQEPQPSPLIKPLQAECKGEFDAHILLLDLPASRLQNLKK